MTPPDFILNMLKDDQKLKGHYDKALQGNGESGTLLLSILQTYINQDNTWPASLRNYAVNALTALQNGANAKEAFLLPSKSAGRTRDNYWKQCVYNMLTEIIYPIKNGNRVKQPCCKVKEACLTLACEYSLPFTNEGTAMAWFRKPMGHFPASIVFGGDAEKLEAEGFIQKTFEPESLENIYYEVKQAYKRTTDEATGRFSFTTDDTGRITVLDIFD